MERNHDLSPEIAQCAADKVLEACAERTQPIVGDKKRESENCPGDCNLRLAAGILPKKTAPQPNEEQGNHQADGYANDHAPNRLNGCGKHILNDWPKHHQ